MSRTTGLALLGILYGALLAADAIICAGFGHGTYVPLALYGSPCSLLGVLARFGQDSPAVVGFLCTIFGLPVYWAVVGVTLAQNRSRDSRRLLVAHYVVAMAGWLGLINSDLADWSSLNRTIIWQVIWFPIVAGAAFYSIGQVWVWSKLRASNRSIAEPD